MPYKKWQKIEAEYKAPMATVLEALYAEHHTSKAVADTLHISEQTLIRWREALDCEIEVTRRLRCRVAASSAPTARGVRG